MRPVLFRIPIVNLPIFNYGLLLGLSLYVGWYLVLWLCERDGLDREKMGRLYMWTAGCSVAGARLLYVVTNWEQFEYSPLRIFAVWEGGLAAYGGFLGGFVTGIVYCRVHRIRLLSWADCVVPSLGTGLAFTRIGCFLAGCDFGVPAPDGARWAVSFPKGSPAWLEQLKDHLITADAARSLPIHPTQLYEVANGLVLFGLTMLVRRYRRFSGQMFVAFTMGYAVLRYLVETVRADEDRGGLGPFSESQIIGIVTFVLAGALYVSLWRRYRRDPQSMRYWELPPLDAPVPAPAPVKAKRRRR
jgi:phosphatidylglycerol:prolipoprotein diacylglycerol transferase